jgi:GT2 family glycosyltransferase
MIGAVGPKLLYPNGTLQHGGVILGIEGLTGHFEYGLGADDPGYFGRLNVPFSVSAVTGACLAVSCDKFFAVNGLDEDNFPVELNDVDFCLRLKERGWRNMVDGTIRLVHHESASRGRTGLVQESYPREWNYFRQRWMHQLRDDPAFSPALSLESTRPSLG